jgi:iron complex outermembrane receptor protein
LETTFGTKQNLEQIIGEQLSVQGNFKTGQIKHQLFTGVDMENSFTSIHFTFTPATYGSGNLFDFENFDQGGAIPNGTNTRIVKTDTNRFGIYAQDLISLTEKSKFLAGIRWSWQEAQVETTDLVKKTSTEDKNEKTSPSLKTWVGLSTYKGFVCIC